MQHLSLRQKETIGRFVFWEDRCRTLFGKMLIQAMLEDFGYQVSLISEVELTEYSRPYLKIPLDFNVSHSGEFVVCAASKDCRVGVDIEEWKEIDFKEFSNIFTAAEWDMMNHTQNAIPEFFRIWTQKESVIKADGRGLSWPLNKIEANDIKVVDHLNSWYVRNLDLHPLYSAWIATDHADFEIEIFEKLLF